MRKNKGGVEKLLRDLENEIWEFQSESYAEDELIIEGLQVLILKVKDNDLEPKSL